MSSKATASKTTESKSNTPPASAGRREIHSRLSPQEQLVQLHRECGNRAVRRMYESGVLQTKLKLGQPGDRYEREADRVADRILSMPGPKGDEQEEQELQAKPPPDRIAPLARRQTGDEQEEPVQGEFLRQQAEEEEEAGKQTVEEKGPLPGKFPQRPGETGIQAKTKTGANDNEYEQESDNAAQRLTSISDPQIRPKPT